VAWSAEKLKRALGQGLAINPVIYAEISLSFRDEAELISALDLPELTRLALPYAAAFWAGRAFVEYRRQGGTRRSPLPDFYIGAHAELEKMTLLTRDAARYRSYFPKVKLIAPE
jgi:predicted nucleic acid-binding protein